MATLAPMEELEHSRRTPVEIEVPASTAWPIVLAFGFTLMFAGLLTSASVSVLGLVLSVAGCVGWFREVFPQEHEQTVPVVFEEYRVATKRRVVERVPIAPELLRVWLPLKTYPISAGVKGGVAHGATDELGFAAIEDMGYALLSLMDKGIPGFLATLWLRQALGPFGHGTWTAAICAVLWSRRLTGARVPLGAALGAYLTSSALHAAWDLAELLGAVLAGR